jgi:L-seryl-tRNA(Ser) seleniumtransferase
MMSEHLAKIPSVSVLLDQISLKERPVANQYKKILIEQVLSDVREHPERFNITATNRDMLTGEILREVNRRIDDLTGPGLRRVCNATGVVLHTGLGRAPLGSSVLETLTGLGGFTNLEIRLSSGRRGDRMSHIAPLLKLLTGAEDAVVVNNNAAAVLLCLNSVARRREVIISRGEQVEIGGSFRMPEVMKSSGSRMVEIGATNKTHLADYRNAITEKTAAIMLVHPSNYKIVGFTEKPEMADIIDLAHRNEIPVIFDLGSGALTDMRRFGLDYEPVVADVIQSGVDVVTFSGDKLLGGPQAGIILGRRDILHRIKRNHLLRALRCDKITLTLLRRILQDYLLPESVENSNETLRIFSQKKESLRQRAENLRKQISPEIRDFFMIIEAEGKVGSGAYPVFPIPSYALGYRPGPVTAERMARKLRLNETPVFGYLENDTYMMNMLTLRDEDIPRIAQLLSEVI